MSFSRAIGLQPPTDHEIRIGCPLLEQPSSGWDVLRETLWLPHPFWLLRGSIRDGPTPEGGTFIAQDFRIMDWKGGRPIVEVTSLGIAAQDGKDYKIECSAGIAEDLTLASNPGYSSVWRLSYPRVTKLWVSLTTPDIYDHVGVPSVPPETFGIGGSAWALTYVAPDNWSAIGWIGENRNPQKLPGAAACLVADTWLYDPGYDDRDGVQFFTPP
jgi:hypothetical protein